MSVLLDLVDAAHWLDGPLLRTCWSCGAQVTLPCVVWHGDSLLVLHAECAAHLGAALLKDSRECELAGDPGPHWRRRATAIVRHRLEAEEVTAA